MFAIVSQADVLTLAKSSNILMQRPMEKLAVSEIFLWALAVITHKKRRLKKNNEDALHIDLEKIILENLKVI